MEEEKNLEEIDLLELNEEEEKQMPETNSEVVQKAIKRSEYANMMKVNDTFIRMGKGISEYKKSMNGEKSDEQWIHEDSASHEVESYAPSFDGTLKCYKNEPLFEHLFPLYKARATGADAHVEVADVYIFDKNADGSCPAEISDATIMFNEYDGKELTFEISLNGDPIYGNMTIDSDGKGSFAPNTAN